MYTYVGKFVKLFGKSVLEKQGMLLYTEIKKKQSELIPYEI